jgi:hypothetical protein
VIKAKLKKVLAIIASAIIVASLAVAGLSHLSGMYSCWSEWSESGINHKYAFRGGCKLQKDGSWIPAKNYRID